ncbi:unnamed protein product [Urochloa humidicola]
MVSKPLRVFEENSYDEFLDGDLAISVSECLEKGRGFNANVIQQYRMNGYADIQVAVCSSKDATHGLEKHAMGNCNCYS